MCNTSEVILGVIWTRPFVYIYLLKHWYYRCNQPTSIPDIPADVGAINSETYELSDLDLDIGDWNIPKVATSQFYKSSSWSPFTAFKTDYHVKTIEQVYFSQISSLSSKGFHSRNTLPQPSFRNSLLNTVLCKATAGYLFYFTFRIYLVSEPSRLILSLCNLPPFGIRSVHSQTWLMPRPHTLSTFRRKLDTRKLRTN